MPCFVELLNQSVTCVFQIGPV